MYQPSAKSPADQKSTSSHDDNCRKGPEEKIKKKVEAKVNDNGRIRTYACEHNAYDVSKEIAGHRLNHSATLSCQTVTN
jgi:hypothetical protein